VSSSIVISTICQLDGIDCRSKVDDDAQEVLTRLGYQLSPPQAVLDYNAGISTQVPTGRNLRIQGKKTKRKIGYDNVYVTYEYVN
jgi:hypothetical protein